LWIDSFPFPKDRTCQIKEFLEGVDYGVATISRLLKIIGLVCKRAL